MIERVAKEQRSRRAASVEAALPPATHPPAAKPPPALPGADPEAAPMLEAARDSTLVLSCSKGHCFAALPDHPAVDGTAACPHCMARTIEEYRKKFAARVLPPRFE